MEDIVKPTDVELAALYAEHAHRFPEKSRHTVTGDGGHDVTLPVLLGNPSGACKMPAGKPVSPSWNAVVAATFKVRPDAESITDQFVADCVLWPDQATWAAWTRRWPALPEVVQVMIRRKTGASLSMLEEPLPAAPPPSPLVPVLLQNPSAVWRRLKPPGVEIDVVVSPPDSGVWRMFTDAMKRRNENHAALVRDLATASVLAAFHGDDQMQVGDMFDRWCGQTILIGLVVAHLAGIAAESELGNW